LPFNSGSSRAAFMATGGTMRTTKESRSGLPHHGEPEVDVIEIDGDHSDCWPDERDQQAQATMMLRALSSAEELAA